ncbi:MAG: hypothetical protein NVSMB2_01040 [Chloroflexota bacterium]
MHVGGIRSGLSSVEQGMQPRFHRVLLSVTVLALALMGPVTAHADDADTANVDIIQFAFQPTPLEISAGTTVVWNNYDAIVHSVTNGTPDAPGTAFDSGLFDQGLTFSQTFNDPGQYSYFCTRHNFMQGTVIVS